MKSFREFVWTQSPSRLRTSTAARMVYAFIGVPLDFISEAADQAVRARFPDQCPEDALAYHAKDRGIRRGPNESATSFRSRLLLWIEAWRGAGVGRAMLDQIAGFLTPQTCRMRIWTQKGVVYTRETNGTFTIERVSPTLWNWDGQSSLWARFWVVLYSIAGVPWSRDGTWNDGELWGANATTWGSTATSEQVQGVRQIVDDMKPAQSVCPNIIVAFDAAAFSPSDASPPLPDGNWKNYGKNVGGVQVPARDSRAIYWEGVR